MSAQFHTYERYLALGNVTQGLWVSTYGNPQLWGIIAQVQLHIFINVTVLESTIKNRLINNTPWTVPGDPVLLTLDYGTKQLVI